MPENSLSYQITINTSGAKSALTEIAALVKKLKEQLETPLNLVVNSQNAAQLDTALDKARDVKNELEKPSVVKVENTDAAKAKLDGVTNKAQVMRAEVEKPSILHFNADTAMQSIGAATLAFGGIKTLISETAEALSGFVSAASTLEVVRGRLENMYGSIQKANETLIVVRELAAQTPYSYEQMAQGAAQLEAFGLSAQRYLGTMADLAAYMHEDVPFAVMSFGRAMAGGEGAADIFRERGINQLVRDTQKLDDKMLASKEIYREALVKTLEDATAGVAGSTKKLSQLHEGMLSNMGDAWFTFKAQIGDEIMPEINEAILGTTKYIYEMVEGQHQLTVFIGVTTTAAAGLTVAFTTLAVAWNALKGSISPIIPIISVAGAAIAGLAAVHLTNEAATKANVSESAKLQAQFGILSGEAERLGQKVNRTTWEQEQYADTIKQLKDLHPGFLANIDAEKSSWNEVAAAIRAADFELDKFIQLQARKSIVEEGVSKASAATVQLANLKKDQAQIAAQMLEVAKSGGQTVDELYAKLGDIITRYGSFGNYAKQQFSVDTTLQDFNSLYQRWQEIYDKINAKNKEIGTIKAETEDTLKNMPDVATAMMGGYEANSEGVRKLHDQLQANMDAWDEEDRKNQEENSKNALARAGQDADRIANELNTRLQAIHEAGLNEFNKLTEQYYKDLGLVADAESKGVITHQQAISDKELIDAGYMRDWAALQDEQAKKEQEEQAKALAARENAYKNTIENLRNQKEVGLATLEELMAATEQYVDFCAKEYGRDSQEYSRALADKNAAQLAFAREEAKNAQIRESFAEKTRDLLGGTIQDELDDVDKYYARKHAELRAAGVTEAEIVEQSEAAKQAIRDKYTALAIEGTSQLMGDLATVLKAGGKKTFELYKAAAIAQAIIDAYAAASTVMKTYSKFFPANLALAALQLAKGMINVNAIRATKYAKGGLIDGPGHDRGGVMAAVGGNNWVELEGGEFIINRKATNAWGPRLLAMINEMPAGLPVPAVNSRTYAGGGLVTNGAGANEDRLYDVLFAVQDGITKAIKDQKLTVNNYITANAVVKRADPELVSVAGDAGIKVRRKSWL